MRLMREFNHYPSINRIFSLLHEEENAVFLDSSLRNQLGRYSIIGLSPYLKLVKGEKFTVNGQVCTEPFETWVKNYLKKHKEENNTGLPIASGAIGYFSYDYGRKKEGLTSRHLEKLDIPDCILVFYDNFIIEDHQRKKLYMIANSYGQGAAAGISLMMTLLEMAEKETFPQSEKTVKAPEITADFTREDYMDAVQRMIHYIVEGDIYIANMTQRLQITSSMPPFELFEQLRKNNPSPFGGYFNYGDFQVVSASPERFLKMTDGLIQTRPIKGTRKRGSTQEEDNALKQELEQSGKDKSELLMIVDLERNDLNRVCIPGSVVVDELFSVETYATVFHLIANVTGILRPELTVMDLIEAAFPGGSITGAPKLRAMELIDELEHSRRNLYTGSMGYLSLDGNCDFNIVIRTALYKEGVYHLGVGGGITFESDLAFEYEETLQKAKALLEALGGSIDADYIG